jgi:hypothetical protein
MHKNTRPAAKVSPRVNAKPPAPPAARKASTAPRNPAPTARPRGTSKRQAGPAVDVDQVRAAARVEEPPPAPARIPAPGELWGYVAGQLLALASLVAGYGRTVAETGTIAFVLESLAGLLQRWAAMGGEAEQLGAFLPDAGAPATSLGLWLTGEAEPLAPREPPPPAQLDPADPWGDAADALSALADRCAASDVNAPGAGHLGDIVEQFARLVTTWAIEGANPVRLQATPSTTGEGARGFTLALLDKDKPEGSPLQRMLEGIVGLGRWGGGQYASGRDALTLGTLTMALDHLGALGAAACDRPEGSRLVFCAPQWDSDVSPMLNVALVSTGPTTPGERARDEARREAAEPSRPNPSHLALFALEIVDALDAARQALCGLQYLAREAADPTVERSTVELRSELGALDGQAGGALLSLWEAEGAVGSIAEVLTGVPTSANLYSQVVALGKLSNGQPRATAAT